MKKSAKILKTIFLLIFLFQIGGAIFLMLPNSVSAMKFEPQVAIPGSEFQETEEGVAIGDSTGMIGKYIVAIYKYSIGIVGILAAVVLMWGGLVWLTAGGNSSRIEDAKAWIGAALTGMVLMLGSYTILNIINPDLVNFRISKVEQTEPQEANPFGCCIDKDGNGSTEFEATCKEKGGTFAANKYWDAQESKCSPYDMGGCCGEIYQWAEHHDGWRPVYKYCEDVNSSSNCLGKDNYYTMNKPCSEVTECKATNCSGKSPGTKCGLGGFCYNNVCHFSKGKLGEPCGDDVLGAKCENSIWETTSGGYTCPPGTTRDYGGRDCDNSATWIRTLIRCCVANQNK